MDRSLKLWIITILLLTTGIAVGQEPFSSIFDRLAKVERFAIGGVGYAGVISQGEKDFRAILSRSSITDFEKLYRTGNIQAKVYALVGLRILSPDRYNEFATALRTSKEMVETMTGCIEGKEPLAEVIKRVDAGEYR